MSRMTIIKDDNAVGVDGVFYDVDCSGLPSNFHAMEFFTETNTGEVQWTGNPCPPNTPITSIGEYQVYFDEWNKKVAEQKELEAAAKRARLEVLMSANTPPQV